MNLSVFTNRCKEDVHFIFETKLQRWFYVEMIRLLKIPGAFNNKSKFS